MWVLTFVFFGSFSLYLFGAWPTVGVGDAGELITAAVSLGVAHPPGYPLYTVIGKIATIFIPFGNLAFRVNLASVGLAALAVSLVARWGFSITGKWASAVGAALAVGFGFTLWSQALTAEVYALHAACAAGAIWSWDRAWKTSQPRWVWLACGVVGVGLANHHTMLLLAVPLLAGLVLTRRWSWHVWVMGVLVASVGLGAYGLLMIRSLANPLVDWGNPESFERLAAILLRKQYGTVAPAPRSVGLMAEQAWAYFGLMWEQWPVWWWPVAALGIWRMIRAEKGRVFTWGAAWMATGLAVFWLLNMWVTEHAMSLLEEFVVPSFLLWTWPMAEGLAVIAGWVGGSGLAAIVSLGILLQVGGRWDGMDRSRAYFPAEYTLRMLEGAPPGAHLFCSGDSATFMLMYWHQVEGRRSDMSLYDDTGTVLTDLYGPDFYVTPEPRHSQWMEQRQREVIAQGDRPVCFILGSYLHNLSDASFGPNGLVYQMTNDELGMTNATTLKNSSFVIRHSSLEAWKRYGWHEWRMTLERTAYLERDLLAQVPLARAEMAQISGDRRMARRWYREASRVGAGIDAVQTSLAAILVKKEMYDVALEVAEQAVVRFPHDPDSHNSLGAACLVLRQYDRAILSFQEAIRLRPAMAMARHNLALAFLEKKDWAEAEQAARDALRIAPYEAQLYRHLTTALREQQRLGEIIPPLVQAAERAPHVVDLTFQLGNIYLKLGQPKQAAEAFGRAVHQQPGLTVAANNLGVALGQMGRYPEALEAYLTAVKWDPTYVEACANVAGAYYNLHQFDQAKVWWRRTLELDPNHVVARQFLQQMRR